MLRLRFSSSLSCTSTSGADAPAVAAQKLGLEDAPVAARLYAGLHGIGIDEPGEAS